MKTQKFEATTRNGSRLVINAKTIIGAKRQVSDWQSATDSVTLYYFNGDVIAVKPACNKKWNNI